MTAPGYYLTDFFNCQGTNVYITLVTFKTLCSYCLLCTPNGMPGFFSAFSLFQFFMFILLIFLAELSAAILAFIFKENVSIPWWAKSEPWWDCTQLECGVRWCLICLQNSCLFQIPTNLLHYYPKSAELPASW